MEDLLTELRGYEGWRQDLDVMAQRAAALGRLQAACDAAHARLNATEVPSSNSSSGIRLERGSLRYNQAFFTLLREELRKVLDIAF